MRTCLCLDFGNTRLKAAVFQGSHLEEVLVLENTEPASVAQVLDRYHPTHSILSSVVQHSPSLETYLNAHTKFHRLHHHSRLPFSTPVGKPETIGADRLALCAAAVARFPQSHNLVIGLGSAITFNFINKYHEFLGGSISPGMAMRLRALHEFTALLPLVGVDWNFPLVGYDTRTNILSGVILGMAKEIDGLIEAYQDKYQNFNVLLCGGDTAHFTPLLKKKIFAEPELLFHGLLALAAANLED